ncbi:MAG: insulinase family protein, partial [Flavobacteriales bacterium]|nr:insulinase family protein [Flavobacteriales bacterium]
MITFEKFELENGLKVIVHQDKSTPIVAFNLLYDVGARDEDENKTGFAHLFEHLMFGGSINVPNFDEPLQKVGGDNNAFTSNDITNYYITLPKENLETAFWLESDRMLSLAFTDKSLEVQRQVVIEEFKQNYLNQPYGDVWLLLRPLAYSKHPYKWATIGKEIAHIENATMEDVKDFFFHHYLPNNAILCIAGNIRTEEIKTLTQKWFGEILKGNVKERNLTVEPKQTKERRLQVERDVPSNAIYKAYKMCKRSDNDYFATDLLSDILSMGNSSRLYTSLIKEQKLFSDINA